MDTQTWQARARRMTGVMVAGGLLAACGGGEAFGIGTGKRNEAPAVTLVLGATEAARGTKINLFADASDDDTVSRVVFFRVADNGDASEMGSDDARPYELPLTLPKAGEGRARYFARAVDNDGASTDSATLEVTLTN